MISLASWTSLSASGGRCSIAHSRHHKGNRCAGRNPLIGRPVRADLRELVIGRRARGYVALYRYVAELDTAFALAIRGQEEAGYIRT